jgi:hypothetical protein
VGPLPALQDVHKPSLVHVAAWGQTECRRVRHGIPHASARAVEIERRNCHASSRSAGSFG